MSLRTFSNDEIKQLAANPYTYKVTSGQLSFTSEFKELFWSEYGQHITPSEILRKYGYDPVMLGRSRVTGIQRLIKKEAEQEGSFYNGRRPVGTGYNTTVSDEKSTSADTIKKMQHELEYLRQEMEFLKKISSLKNTRK